MINLIFNEKDFIFKNRHSGTIGISVGTLHDDISVNKNHSGQHTIDWGMFRSLVDAGIDFGKKDIINKFESDLEKYIESEKIKIGREAADFFDNHIFVKVYKENKCCTIIENRGDFINRSIEDNRITSPKLWITYKNHKCRVYYVKHSWSDWRFQISGDVTNYNIRRYKKFESVVAKYKELVDAELKRKVNEEDRRAIKENIHQETLKILDTFNEEIKYHTRYYKYDREGYIYKIRDIEISLHKDYKDGNYIPNGLYKFAGISSLTKDQVNRILDII